MSRTFVPIGEFVYVDEPGAAPLLGDGQNVAIPQGGDVMVYGNGGAGKTTLCVDLAFHLAAGDDWCGIQIAKPARVALIENEGPRPLFRQKLLRKLDAWAGSDVDDQLVVLENPWAQFTFAHELDRAWLAEEIAELALDVVIVGPLTRVGMNEAGTLQQTRDFAALLADVRARCNRPITFVLVHHENKGGQVSGAWEGAGDTLIHVQAQGHGKTRLVWQKCRWSSELHGTSLQLVWADGDSFTIGDTPGADPNTIGDAILAAVIANSGSSWNTIEKAVGGNYARARQIRDQLLAGGQLIDENAAKGGRTMKLWHHADPPRPCVQTHLDAPDAPGGEAA